MEHYNPYEKRSEESLRHIILQHSENRLVFTSKTVTEEKRQGIVYWLSKWIRWITQPESRLEKIQGFFITRINEALASGKLDEALHCCSHLKKFENVAIAKHNETWWSSYLFWTKIPLKHDALLAECLPKISEFSILITHSMPKEAINLTNFASSFYYYKKMDDVLETFKEMRGEVNLEAFHSIRALQENKSAQEKATEEIFSLGCQKTHLLGQLLTFMSTYLEDLQEKILTNSYSPDAPLQAFNTMLLEMTPRLANEGMLVQIKFDEINTQFKKIAAKIEEYNLLLERICEEKEALCAKIPTLSLKQLSSFDFSFSLPDLKTYADTKKVARLEKAFSNLEKVSKKPRHLQRYFTHLETFFNHLNINSSRIYKEKIHFLHAELSKWPEGFNEPQEREHSPALPAYLLEFERFHAFLQHFNPLLNQGELAHLEKALSKWNFTFTPHLKLFASYHQLHFIETNHLCEALFRSKTLPLLTDLKEVYERPFVSKENKTRLYDLFWEIKNNQLKKEISDIYQPTASFYTSFLFSSSKETRVQRLLESLKEEENILPLSLEYQMTIHGLKDYLTLVEYKQFDSHFFTPLYTKALHSIKDVLPTGHPLFELLKEPLAHSRLSVLTLTDFLHPNPLVPKIFTPYQPYLAILAKIWVGEKENTEPSNYPSLEEQNKALEKLEELHPLMQALPTEALSILQKQLSLITIIKEMEFHPDRECAIDFSPLVDAVTLRSPRELPFPVSASSSEKMVKSPSSRRLYNRDSLTDWLKRNSTDPFTREIVSLDDIQPATREQALINLYEELLQEILTLQERVKKTILGGEEQGLSRCVV